ncbi:hypothetical protein FBQ81_01995 [Chloroflexi bacterium CFX6]|nr:hypothetical protein [Chloroflexi bacterium CFX6]
MKNRKLLTNMTIALALVLATFLKSAPQGYAQTDQDWSDPVNLSFSGSATNPVMVIDLRGTIHAIWVDGVDGYKYAQSPDGGVAWSEPRTVKFPFGSKDPSPFLLADSNGSIHIFWISGDQSLYYGQATPVDFPEPGNWKTTSRLARDVLAFDVTLDSAGALHLAYVRKSTTDANPAGVYYRQSIIGGGFWSESRRLYETEYFRSAKQSDVYVRVSASNTRRNQKVFVTWDNRAQKRVFMAASNDAGQTWGDPQQIQGPEDTGGIDAPFNLTVAAFGNNVLLVWQAGEPGSSKCTVYSQWSDNGGVNWGDIVAVLGGRSECPLSTKIIGRDENYASVLLIGQVSPIMVAWDGAEWSDPQTQTQLPSFSNPLTFDAILLGCRFDLIQNDHLYVAGCDQGRGKDVWFLSRPLTPVKDWFAPSVFWGEPDALTVKSENPERISNFHAAPDSEGNIHAVWVQSPVSVGSASSMAIKYARWNGRLWTTPESVITSLSGKPLQVMAAADPLQRLLLTWIDGYNGDLVFSWANLERANLVSEWVGATGLPIPSRLINAADVVVDGAGRIFTVYVVPVNEERGIYITQSRDNGSTWSVPVRVFDAVEAGWERIEQPKIVLDSRGVLHLVFVRAAIRLGQPEGLYYSRSEDGGFTWSDAQLLTEGRIQWVEAASYGEQTVHVVWQEFDGLVFANVSQVSEDGGVSWGKQNSITGVNETSTLVSLASNGNGLLHFIQMVRKSSDEEYNRKSLVLQDWEWDGTTWNLELTKDVVLKGAGIDYSLFASVTSTGFLGVFIPVEYTDPAGIVKSEILTYSRFIEGAGSDGQAEVPIVPTPITESGAVDVSALQPTPTPDFSILYNDNVSTSPLQRNAAGLVLIGVGVLVTLFLVFWRRPLKREQ